MSSVRSVLTEKIVQQKEVDENDRPLTEMELELINKNDQINKFRDENAILGTNIKDLQNQNKQQAKQIHQLVTENEKLEKQIYQLVTENKKLEKQIELIIRKVGLENVDFGTICETKRTIKAAHEDDQDHHIENNPILNEKSDQNIIAKPGLAEQSACAEQQKKKRSHSNDEQNTTCPSAKKACPSSQ